MVEEVNIMSYVHNAKCANLRKLKIGKSEATFKTLLHVYILVVDTCWFWKCLHIRLSITRNSIKIFIFFILGTKLALLIELAFS